MSGILSDDALDVLFRTARTQNAWTDKPVSDAELHAIYDLCKWAPTTANSNPMRIVFVKTKAAKEKLAPALSEGNLNLEFKLQMIDDATTDQDLRVPPSNHLEKLRGDLAAFHSIRVNKQWQLIFQWDGAKGEASGVYLDDHSY